MVVDSNDASAEETQPDVDSHERWRSHLHLHFSAESDETRMRVRDGNGRLSVAQPHFPEGKRVCHTSIGYPRGAIATGSALEVRMDLTDAGHALVSTRDATRLNRSPGPVTVLDTKLTVSNSATLEWLPLEISAEYGSRADVSTRVILEEGARFIGWNVVSLRPSAPGGPLEEGHVSQQLEVRRAGEVLVNERHLFDHPESGDGSGWGPPELLCNAVLVAVHPDGIDALLVEQVRRALARAGVLATLPSGSPALLVRVLAPGADQALDALRAVWSVIRLPLLDRQPDPATAGQAM